MKEELVVYVLRDSLASSGGSGWKQILKDMLAAKVINSFAEAIEIRLDKAKALHFQTILEFHDTERLFSKPSRKSPKESQE